MFPGVPNIKHHVQALMIKTDDNISHPYPKFSVDSKIMFLIMLKQSKMHFWISGRNTK